MTYLHSVHNGPVQPVRCLYNEDDQKPPIETSEMLVLIPWLCKNVLDIDGSVASAIVEIVRNDTDHLAGCVRLKVKRVYRRTNNEETSKEAARPSYTRLNYSDDFGLQHNVGHFTQL